MAARYVFGGDDRYGYFPRGVKWLLILNTVLFVIYFLTARTGFGQIFDYFALVPAAVVGWFAIWQLFTYMFLHYPFGFSHILFNMLTLWMFGRDLERTWGTKRFLQYYFLCGVGAGVCVVGLNAMFGDMHTRTIGASGAIYGVLLAFGMLFPDTTVFFSFLFPIKAKYFVMILGAIAFLMTLGSTGGGVSHVAHLGGMVFGYLYLKSSYSRMDLLGALDRQYRDWKLQRAKKRFQVYLRKRGSGHDHWVN